MAEQKRIMQQGLTYHVRCRCGQLEHRFKDREARDIVHRALDDTRMKYRFHLAAKMILPWEVHLLIQTKPNGHSLNRIMQYFNSRVGREYNRQFHCSGPFWNERYRSRPVNIRRERDNPLMEGYHEYLMATQQAKTRQVATMEENYTVH